MNSYNPYSVAIGAAFSELISDRARRYYNLRTQQDIQTILVFIVQFGCMAYELGAQCRTWCKLDTVSKSVTVTDIVLAEMFPDSANIQMRHRDAFALLPVQCAGLLMPAKYETISYLSGVEVSTQEKRMEQWMINRIRPSAIALSLVTKLEQSKSANFADLTNLTNLGNLTIRQLRASACEKGIKNYSKKSKAQLVELLRV